MAQLSAVESLNAVGVDSWMIYSERLLKRLRRFLQAWAPSRNLRFLHGIILALGSSSTRLLPSRELPQHVGISSRFQTIREHREFEAALDLHCREASRIIKEFAGEWFSKHTYEGGIDEAKAGRFAHVAFQKMREELRHWGAVQNA